MLVAAISEFITLFFTHITPKTNGYCRKYPKKTSIASSGPGYSLIIQQNLAVKVI